MRVTDGAGLRAALAALVEGVPSLTVYLDTSDDLRVDDSARAHCVLRCVQEIITNALRHARATNCGCEWAGRQHGHHRRA